MRKTRPGWLFILLALLAALSLLAAACGGDDDDDSGDDEAEPTAEETADSGEDEDDEEEEAEETPEDEEEEDEEDEGDSSEELSDLAERYSSFRGKVTYEVTGFGGEEEGIDTMTIYQSDDASRFDIAGSTGTTTLITTAEEVLICAEGSCLRYPTDAADANPLSFFTDFLSSERIQEQLQEIPEGVEIEPFSEEIAGVDASCYRFSGDVDETGVDDAGSFCFNDDGVLLAMDVTEGDELGSFRATEFGDVSDEDFEAPFPVQDLGDLGDLEEFGQ